MNKKIIIVASLFGVLAVVTGAFGAHTLKKMITIDSLEVWQTAVQYHFYHTFALLFLSTFARFKNNLIKISAYCFSLGIILFSGSLYLLATKVLYASAVNLSFLGPITPLGGAFFIVGWVCLLMAAVKDK